MDSSAQVGSLAFADDAPPAPLDPSVWARNLAAIGAEDTRLAAELQNVSLPETWRPVLGLDGFATWRLEPPGQPPQWLGLTAAPLTRAGGLLARAEFAPLNYALPTAAAGAELHILLQRLPALLAIYVFEADIRTLAAVLRLHDVSQAVTRGRCIFVAPGRELEAVGHTLSTHPGLLPPAEILLPDLVSSARQDELRRIGEELHRRCERQRTDDMKRSQAVLATLPATPSATPRLAILSLTGSPTAAAAAESIRHAAAALGWTAAALTVTEPRHMHPLLHVRRLAEFQPDLLLCVNHGPARLPAAARATTCVWVHDETALPASNEAHPARYLAATPRVVAALESAGVAPPAILPWYWACEADSAADDSAAGDDVLLVADLPDTRPENCGIAALTHRQLWERIRQLLVRGWQTPRILRPDLLLTQAQRETGVELEDALLRDTVLQLVERVLSGAVVAEQVARALVEDAGCLLVLGRGWDRAGLAGVRCVGGHLGDWPAGAARPRPRLCVLAGHRDPLHPVLVQVAARGWPLAVHRPGGASLTEALGGVLRPDEHFEPFTDVGELRRALKLLRGTSPAAKTRAARARQHVVANHSFSRRLETLLQALRDARTAPE
ncbi:MAG: glycosyltransferase [Planctomycetota bacterium]